MDTGWAPRLPRLQDSHGGGGWSLLPRTVGAQTGTASGSAHFGIPAWGLGQEFLAGAPSGLMLTPGEQDGGKAWVPGAADMAPELSCWARPSASSSDKRGSKDLLQKHGVSVVARNTSRMRKVRWPGAPPPASVHPPTPPLPGPSSTEQGTPSSLRSPASREGGREACLGRRDHGPSAGAWAGGKELGEGWPRGQMSGRPSSSSS